MRYQYKREPLTGDEATRLANACNPHEEKLVVWVLLDTGLRVSELANLKRANLDWQTHRLMIYGKGGPFGSKSKRRVIPLSARIQPLIEGYFALHETFGFSTRTIQRMLKRLANRARISRAVSPHVLRHTFAVTAIQKGISLPALQRLLGGTSANALKIQIWTALIAILLLRYLKAAGALGLELVQSGRFVAAAVVCAPRIVRLAGRTVPPAAGQRTRAAAAIITDGNGGLIGTAA